MRILLRALRVDEDLQNHRGIGELSEGMDAALHGIWSGRAIWRESKQKKADAEHKEMVEALKKRR